MLYSVDTGGNPTYRLTDGLGSTVALADASGAVTDTYTYDVFGDVRSHSGPSTTEFTFTGEQNDPNGFEYLRARYYEPGTGRFLSRDPVEGDPALPGTLNAYPYVLNNPVNLLDPTGECVKVFGRRLPCPKKELRAVQTTAVLGLDVIAVALSGSAALLTDTFTVVGCFTPITCLGGYLTGVAASQPFVLIGNFAGGAAFIISCAPSAFEGCEQSLRLLITGIPIPDPNLNLLVDAETLCRDLGRECLKKLCEILQLDCRLFEVTVLEED